MQARGSPADRWPDRERTRAFGFRPAQGLESILLHRRHIESDIVLLRDAAPLSSKSARSFAPLAGKTHTPSQYRRNPGRNSERLKCALKSAAPRGRNSQLTSCDPLRSLWRLCLDDGQSRSNLGRPESRAYSSLPTIREPADDKGASRYRSGQMQINSVAHRQPKCSRLSPRIGSNFQF